MLVISRKRREQVVIDDNVVVTVLEVRGRAVKLGIEAPGEVPVHRKEVFRAICDSPPGQAATPVPG